jgi:hypothetical protein
MAIVTASVISSWTPKMSAGSRSLALGPEMVGSFSFDELRSNADPIAGFA